MAPEIASLPQPTEPAQRPWVLPPKLTVSAETRRLLMELLEDDEEDEAPAPVADFLAYRARRRG